MKFTLNSLHNKQKESKGITTTTVLDEQGKLVTCTEIMLSIDPKADTTWNGYDPSGLNYGRFVGVITIEQVIENAEYFRLPIEVYLKKLVSYYLNTTFTAGFTTEINS